jgi:hypothetical protein
MEMMARQRTDTTRAAQQELPTTDWALGEVATASRSTNAGLASLSLLDLESSELDPSYDAEKVATDNYEHYLEPTASGGISLAHGEIDDPEPDLGVNVGKMWMTDRIGGLCK